MRVSKRTDYTSSQTVTSSWMKGAQPTMLTSDIEIIISTNSSIIVVFASFYSKTTTSYNLNGKIHFHFITNVFKSGGLL